MQRDPCDNAVVEYIGLTVEQIAEESHSPPEDELRISQQTPFLVSDVLRGDLPCLFRFEGLESPVDSPLVVLLQVLLQLLNAPLEESVVRCESDPLDFPTSATNIPSRLTPLWTSNKRT